MEMIIAVLVIYFLTCILIFFKQKESADNEIDYKSPFRKIITIGTIFLAIIQAPFFYYYTTGPLAFFVRLPYLAISLILTGMLLTPLIKRKKISAFQKYGIIVAVVIGTLTLFFGSSSIEKLDWELRQKERNQIIEKILRGEITDNVIKTRSFPPISNGGNEIMINTKPEGTITVTFYIDRGFIDHYSAFIYTTDTTLTKIYDERAKTYNKIKIDDNWYRIAE